MAGLGRRTRVVDSVVGSEIAHRRVSMPTQRVAAEQRSAARRTWTGIVNFLGRQLREAWKSPVTVTLVVFWWGLGLVFSDLVHGPTESQLEVIAAGGPSFQSGYFWTPIP